MPKYCARFLGQCFTRDHMSSDEKMARVMFACSSIETRVASSPCVPQKRSAHVVAEVRGSGGGAMLMLKAYNIAGSIAWEKSGLMIEVCHQTDDIAHSRGCSTRLRPPPIHKFI